VFLRVSSKARGMKIFVPGFRALYDTAKGPDSEFNEGPRGLSLVRPAARDVHREPAGNSATRSSRKLMVSTHGIQVFENRVIRPLPKPNTRRLSFPI
jgi:hypothetical protein